MTKLFALAMWFVLGMGLQGCSGGGGSSAASPVSAVTAGDVLVTLNIKNAAGQETQVLDLDAGEAVWLYATVKDVAGNVIADADIDFSLSNSSVASLPIASAKVVNGFAQTQIVANQQNTGEAYVMASVRLSGGARAASARYGFSVYSKTLGNGKLMLGALTMASPVVAYGSTTVSVPVSVIHSVSIDGIPNSYPVTVPIVIKISSPCLAAGKASISPAVTSVTGVAVATYQDYGCGKPTAAADILSASVTAPTAGDGMWTGAVSKTVNVSAPLSNNLQFVSTTATTLFARGIGSDSLAQSANLKFKVLDGNGVAKANQLVMFSVSPSWATTASLSSTLQNSDSNGEVSVSLNAGTDPAKVSVIATLFSDWSVTAQSSPVAITGLPSQDYFYLNISRRNIEVGATAVLNVIAYDRHGNPASEGTTIHFVSEGGTLQGSIKGLAECQTNRMGSCSVSLQNTEYRPIAEKNALGFGVVAAKDGNKAISIDRYGQPAQAIYVQNGRVSVVAYAAGEKGFTDKNSNGKWDADEVYFDMGDPFLDRNEDGKMSTDLFGVKQEPQTYSAIRGTEECAAHDKSNPVELIFDQSVLNPTYVDALNAAYTCNNSMEGEKSKAWARRNAVLIFSGNSPQVNKDYYLGPLCSESIPFWLMDENGNPLPQGTRVSIPATSVSLSFLKDPANPFSAVAATATISSATAMVPDSIHAGGTLHQISINAGSECSHTIAPLTGNVSGSLTIQVTLPSGAVTMIPYGINNH